jgi:hypothetical protein
MKDDDDSRSVTIRLIVRIRRSSARRSTPLCPLETALD